MTNEERDLITRFIQRVAGVQPGGFSAGAAATPQLPPVDREADALIGELLTRYPEARYRLTQTAFVQEHALVEAQNRIQRLEWELQQARQQQQQQSQQPPASPWGTPPQQQPEQRGFFGGLFGGGSRQAPPQQAYGQQQQYAPPPPQPQYPPGYNPGMFQQQRGGSGFLGGALATAAGVAGGMVAGHALMNMFSGGSGMGNLASAPGDLGGAAAAASPWAGGDAGAASDPYAAGGADKSFDNAGAVDQGGWQQPVADQSWDDQQTIDSAGWDDGSGGGDDWS